MAVVARFRITTRCRDCVQASAHTLNVHDAEDAPLTVDELLVGARLQRTRFRCGNCGSERHRIIGATQFALLDAVIVPSEGLTSTL